MQGNLFSSFPDNTPISLSQLAAMIGRTLHTSPELSGVWVMAELSDVRINGGHCYMELVEKDDAGKTLSKMRANIWANVFNALRHKFYGSTGRDITTGMKVMIKGNTTHHSIYGLAFNVTDINPEYTLGDIERLRREILARLQKEGVINNNRTLPLTDLPQRIAVISARGAAGLGDFINQLTCNPEGYVFYPVIIPAIMQGERTPESVIQALDFIEQTIDLWDCVAIVRGGGATTDLLGFDNYELAKRVATFSLPVIVGIGHERDRTVLDEIAHTRTKTPTAAAAFFIQTAKEAHRRVENAVDRICRYSQARISGESARLAHLSASLPALALSNIRNALMNLNSYASKLPVLTNERLSKSRARLEEKKHQINLAVSRSVSLNESRLDRAEESLRTALKMKLATQFLRLDNLSKLVDALNPTNTLRRGYAVVRLNNKALTSGANVRKGDKLDILLADGNIRATAD